MSSISARAARTVLPLVFVALVSACAPKSGTPPAEPAPTARPASATGSTSAPSVSGEVIANEANRPIEEILASRVAGVTLSRAADGGIAVRIRGTQSNANEQPLYILDGLPFIPGQNGSLSGINPYDIESIRVLKDAADITMYGSRGANGVIVIKTKSRGKP
jgi:TonB-dependent SusC/RagA subfamily outer membrane receptor